MTVAHMLITIGFVLVALLSLGVIVRSLRAARGQS